MVTFWPLVPAFEVLRSELTMLKGSVPSVPSLRLIGDVGERTQNLPQDETGGRGRWPRRMRRAATVRPPRPARPRRATSRGAGAPRRRMGGSRAGAAGRGRRPTRSRPSDPREPPTPIRERATTTSKRRSSTARGALITSVLFGYDVQVCGHFEATAGGRSPPPPSHQRRRVASTESRASRCPS